MFLTFRDGRVLDYDMQFLEELLQLLDGPLERLLASVSEFVDPDSWGAFDSAEYTIGLGLVACQSYLVATYSDLEIEKVIALKSGPVHSSGQTIVELINHAANFWKHHDEWSLPSNKGRGQRVCEALDALLVDDTFYPVTTILGH
jgi:hypothetical protein